MGRGGMVLGWWCGNIANSSCRFRLGKNSVEGWGEAQARAFQQGIAWRQSSTLVCCCVRTRCQKALGSAFPPFFLSNQLPVKWKYW